MTNASPFSRVDFSLIDRRIFYPRRDPFSPVPAGAEDHSFPVEPGIEIGGRFYPADSAGPLLLFFHGNGEIASDYDEIGPAYNRLGISLLVADYRGYGRSQGNPSVSTLLSDALTVFDQVEDWRQNQGRTGPLLIMGRSLGSAPAIEIAWRRKERIAALILDSAFAYTLPLLKVLGIPVDTWGLHEEDGFRNHEKISSISKPTLLIAGRRDDLIPYTESETLLQLSSAQRKELVLVPGAGHNDIFARCGAGYFELVSRFIKPLLRKQKR
ncbi:MAG: alpha/beta fold hydrolase [Deltaproteobacteria bacterium]|nr:alpha/beta fold hydrolase [Deltaproteobacteria bacterium]